MICPLCESVNRDDRDKCYHCDSDLSMLRLVINKAKQHYNLALEHAERQRYDQAIAELRNTLDLSGNFAQAHVVLGTIYAKLSRFDEARTHWEKALALNPDCLKAYQYLKKVEVVREALPTVRRLRLFIWSLALLTVLFAGGMFLALRSNPDIKQMNKALDLYLHNEWGDAQEKFQTLTTSSNSFVAEDANQWVHIISLQIENEVTQIGQNLAEGNLLQARKAMAALIKKKANEPNSEHIRSLAKAIQKRDFQLLADTLGQWRLQQKTPEEALKLIEELEPAYAGDTRIQEARQAVQSALDSRKANSLDRILADYETTSNTQEAIRQVRRFLAANPNHQAAEGFLAILLKE
ncbi:MAG: tetratricopeptide repeat protein, partial [Candidatus Sumerlaeota bacterium]|nr:tetratricopeptide repeat protein [Candidatus Sumerlaeota bacterium]